MKGPEEFQHRLCAALKVDPNLVERIVIDVQPDHVIQVYVQMVGDPDVLMNLDLPAAIRDFSKPA